MKKVVIILTVVFCVFFSNASAADLSLGKESNPKFSLSISVLTKHTPSGNFNENNRGFVLEYYFPKAKKYIETRDSLLIGTFNNSNWRRTNFIGYQKVFAKVFNITFSGVVGIDLSGGYKDINPVHPIIGTLRFSTIPKKGSLGWNLDIFPPGKGSNFAGVFSVKYTF